VRNRIGRPSPALVIAVIALIAATSGNAIADGVTAMAAKLGKNSVTSKEVKDGSLTLADFKAKERDKLKGAKGAEGSAGAKGATGATGPAGPAGATGAQGPAGTPNGYTKTEADGKFLATAGKAADSEKLDGIDSAGFVQGRGTVTYNHAATASSANNFLALGDVAHLNVECIGGSPQVDLVTDQANVTYSYSLVRNGAATNAGTDLVTTSGSTVAFGASSDGILTLQLWRGSTLVFASNDAITATVSVDAAATCGFTGMATAMHRDAIVLTPLP
jgi:hypothetical protein